MLTAAHAPSHATRSRWSLCAVGKKAVDVFVLIVYITIAYIVLKGCR